MLPRGAQLQIDTTVSGGSLMEVLRNAGVEGIQALCGGCCSCATCHVYVDAAWYGKLAPPTEEEIELLCSTDSYAETSRLSCQIEFTSCLDGLRVTVAPED